MSQRRKLPLREYVFIGSLLKHGFRKASPSSFIKENKCYIIPSDSRGDSSGDDFYIKIPEIEDFIPIQITQPGVQIFKKFQKPDVITLEKFIEKSEVRIREKRQLCKRDNVVFVLVSDFLGTKTNRNLAWSDKKALEFALRSFVINGK